MILALLLRYKYLLMAITISVSMYTYVAYLKYKLEDKDKTISTLNHTILRNTNHSDSIYNRLEADRLKDILNTPMSIELPVCTKCKVKVTI